MKSIGIMLLGLQLAATLASAANLAYDTASDPAYAGGWTNGSNGGYGFGSWYLFTGAPTTNAGHYLGNSTLNGDGVDNGITGGVAGDGDIGTTAWGLYASGFNVAFAYRPFTGGPLSSGQTFSVNYDHGILDPITTNYFNHIGLLDANSNTIFQIIWYDGSTYGFADSNPSVTWTPMPQSTEGMKLDLTMTGPTSYVATLTRYDGFNLTWPGNMDAPPAMFFFDNNNAGDGDLYHSYANAMSIVPEPSTIALGALGVLGVALRALRRRVTCADWFVQILLKPRSVPLRGFLREPNVS